MDSTPNSQKTSFLQNSLFLRTSIAGGFAGAFEHLITFPFDTLKTRMQFSYMNSQSVQLSAKDMLLKIARKEGVARLYRGITAILVGAIPSHSVYFATYEKSKSFFGISHVSYNSPHLVFLSGALATFAHDMIVTPLDVVKQRMQLPKTKGNFLAIANSVFKAEGAGSFFRSLPTTIFINVPYQGVYFVSYEVLRATLSSLILGKPVSGGVSSPSEIKRRDRFSYKFAESALWLGCGATAGALAGFVTNPLDVVKTYIQTHPQNNSLNTLSLLRLMVLKNGWRVLLAGSSARVITCAPAAGICWMSYETMKRFLGWDLVHEH